MPSALLETLRVYWKRCGVIFPRDPKIVIFHSVTIKDCSVWTSHCGLLFRDGSHYIFLEKDGPFGPYVRLEFADLNDLFVWYKAAVRPSSDGGNIVFATINDERIYRLN